MKVQILQAKTLEKTVQKIPFLRLVVSLIIGIILGNLVQVPLITILALLCASLLLMILLNSYYKYRFAPFFGLSVVAFFIALGLFVITIYNQKPRFYNNATFQATILEGLQEKPASYQSVLHIFNGLKNDSLFKTDEKVLVYFEKTEEAKMLQPGDNIIFDATPVKIKNRGNPFEFDFKKYEERKRIYRQLYLPGDEWQKTNTKPSFSLVILAEKLREKLLDIYRAQHLRKAQFQILSALTLGYKRGLDPEIKTVFASAGTMHVLAVSGLHVGIIYGLLLFTLGFLKRKKTGRLLFVLITLFCLWAYAFITGLSPSVERAATMFSLLVIGENLKRRINIYNSLAASALLLLLINPNNLFEAGFQLSYSAVFGIVFLQPHLLKIINVKNKIGNFFWILLTVSIAAQVATFPITLFYFNQFPTYFWLSNLLVIPVVSLLIPLGLSLLVFARVPLFAQILSTLTRFLIRGIYFLLQQIEQLPFSVLHESVNAIELVFITGLLLSFLLLLNRPQAKYIKTGLLSIFLLLATASFQKIHRLKQKEIIVYNYPDNTIVQLIAGKENFVLSKKPINNNDYAEILLNETTEKLHLENPVLITPSDTLINEHLFAKNGVVLFENKTILFEQPMNLIPENYTVDFVINPKISKDAEWKKMNNTEVIINEGYFHENSNMSNRLYTVTSEGAFRKKW